MRNHYIAMTIIDESNVVFELPADNPRKKANPLSIVFFRYGSIADAFIISYGLGYSVIDIRM